MTANVALTFMTLQKIPFLPAKQRTMTGRARALTAANARRPISSRAGAAPNGQRPAPRLETARGQHPSVTR
jgi:hypothetical protein